MKEEEVTSVHSSVWDLLSIYLHNLASSVCVQLCVCVCVCTAVLWVLHIDVESVLLRPVCTPAERQPVLAYTISISFSFTTKQL